MLEFLALAKRGMILTTNCDKCLRNNREEMESLRHIFRDCEFASHVWRGRKLSIRTDGQSSNTLNQWILNWVSLLRRSHDDEDYRPTTYFIATLRGIWMARKKGSLRETGKQSFGNPVNLESISVAYIIRVCREYIYTTYAIRV